MTLSLNIPTLTTERLIMRAPEARDFDHVAAFFASKERSWGFGGPLERSDAWRWFASVIGHWALHDYGFWIVETREGDTVGMVGLWSPEGWVEPELGWVMFTDASQGKGYAKEAAIAARAHAYGPMGWTTLVSNIFPGNTRSVALAERLGCTCEGEHQNVTHGTELVYRHPAPQDLDKENANV